jgi:tRNA 2-thiocytidine biosynthesis protein TtcA
MDIGRLVSRKIDKAIFAYGMIKAGDRVLIGISGGKDSVTLAHQLGLKARTFSIPFHLQAVHVRTEYADMDGLERLRKLAESIELPFEQIAVSVVGRLKTGRRMNCYWCSTQRRTELLRYAEAHGFNKIALGHHMEDILETFLMNLTHNGELSTMLPVLKYERYPQWIIRPLAWVSEEETEAYARSIGYETVRCHCGFDSASRRTVTRRILDQIVAIEGPRARRRMMEALHNVRADYLPVFQSSRRHDDGTG